MKQHEKIHHLVLSGLLIAFSLALLFQAVSAGRMRLSGDDYCYNAVLSSHGFWGMQPHSYMNVSMYNGNRYSLTFFSGLSGLVPVWGSAFISIFSLLAWVSGLTVGLRILNKELKIGLSMLEMLLIVNVFTCLVLWSTPKLDQSFLWRSGMIPYFMPLVAGTWFIVLVVSIIRKGGFSWIDLSVVFLSAVVIGGFSETATAVFGGFWGLILVGILACRIFWRGNIRGMLAPVLVAVIGVLISIVLLSVSPTTAARRATMPAAMSIGEFIPHLGRNIYTYFWLLLFRRTIHVVTPIIFGFAAGLVHFLSPRVDDLTKSSKGAYGKPIGLLMITGVMTVLLVGCVMLPGSYVFSDYPPERAFVLSQAVVTGACMLSGVVLSFLIARLSNSLLTSIRLKRAVRFIGVFLLISTVLVPIMFIQLSYQKYRKYDKWARFWDERHAVILQAASNNAGAVHVKQLDKIIDEVGELSADPDYWYNNCAEMYYGVNAIHADLPGWDQ